MEKILRKKGAMNRPCAELGYNGIAYEVKRLV